MRKMRSHTVAAVVFSVIRFSFSLFSTAPSSGTSISRFPPSLVLFFFSRFVDFKVEQRSGKESNTTLFPFVEASRSDIDALARNVIMLMMNETREMVMPSRFLTSKIGCRFGWYIILDTINLGQIISSHMRGKGNGIQVARPR